MKGNVVKVTDGLVTRADGPRGNTGEGKAKWSKVVVTRVPRLLGQNGCKEAAAVKKNSLQLQRQLFVLMVPMVCVRLA